MNNQNLIIACPKGRLEKKVLKYLFERGVIVEDATSATTVAPFCTGIALLGTSLLDSYMDILKQYETLVVALDPDAYAKSFDIQKTLSVYTNCRIALIRDDLKYFNKEQAMYELQIG
mgnify:CR=1 FL=1